MGRFVTTGVGVGLGLALCCGSAVAAQTADGFDYAITNGEAVITAYSGVGGAVQIPAVVAGVAVVRLGVGAFYGCDRLTAITFPGSVRSIGRQAFAGCTGLSSIVIPKSVTNVGVWAFSGCSALRSVRVQEGVVQIGEWAFARCSSLEWVQIPGSLTNLSPHVFYACSKLVRIAVAGGNPSYRSAGGVLFDKAGTALLCCPRGLSGSYRVPSGVVNIGDWAFYQCGGLTAVQLPASVTQIGHASFAECSGLASVEIPYGVTNIGDWAFSECRGLATVTLGAGVGSVGYGAFPRQGRLTHMVLHSEWAVRFASGYVPETVRSIVVGDGVSLIDRHAFSGLPVQEITVTSNVTDLASEAFAGCSKLERVRFLGDAPEAGANVFGVSLPMIAYVAGRSGWNESFGGRPTVLWQPVKVVFDPAGGLTGLAEWMYSAGEPYGLLPVPSRDGYFFTGWRAAVSCTPGKRCSEGVAVTSRDTVSGAEPFTLKATWQPLPVLTVIRGSVAGYGTNRVTALPGEMCVVEADTAPDGRCFSGWIITPAGVRLGDGFEVTSPRTTVTVPTNQVTVTAAYVLLPKLTVNGGAVEDEDSSAVFVRPGDVRVLCAAEVSGRVFEKWTAKNGLQVLGGSFNPRWPRTSLIMPYDDVTLTARYVTAPGTLAVFVPDVEGQEVSGVYWSVDGETWVRSSDVAAYPLAPGRYTITFKSVNPRWLEPAKRTVALLRDQEVHVWAAATYVPFVYGLLDEASPVGSGTVSLLPDSGRVLPGRSVTLTAKPAAGYVFAGWSGAADLPAGDDRKAVITLSPTADTVCSARFRPRKDCESPRLGLAEDALALTVGVPCRAVLAVNDGALPVTFSAASLPDGLTLSSATGVIMGVPRKAGTFSTTFRATGAGGGSLPLTCTYTVAALPVWAQGAFNGVVASTTLGTGLARLNITAQGGVSGRLQIAGTNYAFRAESFNGREGDGTLLFTSAVAVANAAVPMRVEVRAAESEDAAGGAPATLGLIRGTFGEDGASSGTVTLYRYVWKDACMASVVTNYTGCYEVVLPGADGCRDGFLTLVVGNGGNVKISGRLSDGTAVSQSGVLIMDAWRRVWTFLYTAPITARGVYIMGVAQFAQEDDGGLSLLVHEGQSLAWYNCSPSHNEGGSVSYMSGWSNVSASTSEP